MTCQHLVPVQNLLVDCEGQPSEAHVPDESLLAQLDQCGNGLIHNLQLDHRLDVSSYAWV